MSYFSGTVPTDYPPAPTYAILGVYTWIPPATPADYYWRGVPAREVDWSLTVFISVDLAGREPKVLDFLYYYNLATCTAGRGACSGFEQILAEQIEVQATPIVDPSAAISTLGFRLAIIPEPSTSPLLIAGLLGLAGWRRMRDQ